MPVTFRLSAKVAPGRPMSCVSHGAGAAGLAGLALWLFFARHHGWSAPTYSIVAAMACAVPTILWSVWMDKVHQRPSTGLSWRTSNHGQSLWSISAVKLVGFWAVWALIGLFYCVFRWYWRGSYIFAMNVLADLLPVLLLLSIAYVSWIDRYLIQLKDGAWHFGACICRLPGWSGAAIAEFARAWAVKAFFLAFMLSILPGSYGVVVARDWDEVLASPFAFATWFIALMFVIDIMFGTIGYVLTLRPLDAHIRSAEPNLAGWVAALICYPPFVLMGEGRVFDARFATFGEDNWVHWLPNSSIAHAIWGAVLVLLTGIYAWSTVAFGPRFSNLTHRGIITHGPYALSKHPAYISKVMFWWLSVTPFWVASGKVTDMVRNCFALACISAIYYWRAKTEEKHLSCDPIYRDYAEWIAQNGLLARLARRGRGWRKAIPIPFKA